MADKKPNAPAAALAQQPVPNMPAKNPFLADSEYPISHFNPVLAR